MVCISILYTNLAMYLSTLSKINQSNLKRGRARESCQGDLQPLGGVSLWSKLTFIWKYSPLLALANQFCIQLPPFPYTFPKLQSPPIPGSSVIPPACKISPFTCDAKMQKFAEKSKFWVILNRRLIASPCVCEQIRNRISVSSRYNSITPLSISVSIYLSIYDLSIYPINPLVHPPPLSFLLVLL